MKLLRNPILLFSIFLFLASVKAQTSELNQSRTAKKITIASEPDYPPYCIVDDEGNADGFSVELFKKAANTVGLEVEVRIGVWDKIKKDLAEGKIDALPLVGRTPEREPLYDFTLPYLRLHGAIFVRDSETSIKSVEDLKDKTILVMEGDNAEEFVRRKNLSKNIITTHTFNEAFDRLSSGEGDAVITQRIVGLEILESEEIENVVPLAFELTEFRQDFCFAVTKGNTELLERLNEGLSIVIANGTFDELHYKWFGPGYNERVDFKNILKISLYIIIPFIIAFSIAAILLLRVQVRRKTETLEKEILEHEKTLHRLHTQQQLLTEMERVTKVGGWEYDVQNKQLRWTNGVYEIYDISPDDIDLSDQEETIKFFINEDQEKIKSVFTNAVNEGTSFDLELRLITLAGEQKWISISGNSVTENGRVVRVFGNIMDITKQREVEYELRRLKEELEIIVAKRTKELEEKVEKLNKSEKAMLHMIEDLNEMTTELKRERKKLEESNKELDAFSYSVSHDLRAPLRAITGFGNILLEDHKDELSEEGIDLLEDIVSNTDKMGHLIDDLLTFSRLSRKDISKSEINMEQLFKEIFEEEIERTEDSKAELCIEKLPNAFGDPALLKQVITNLISNAIKFSSKRDKPVIQVSAKFENGFVVYSVADNGVGFNMKYVDKLFGVFQRLHGQNEFPGTGVGLAIVQRIIKRHGGKVWVDAEIDEGATFYFSLPTTNNSQ